VNISVCVKRVPDTETRIRVGGDGASIDPSGVKFVVSPYDEFAVEAALRLKEAARGPVRWSPCPWATRRGRTSSGPRWPWGPTEPSSSKGEVTMDGLATAKALAAELEGHDAPLVLLGVKAADDDQQQVGPMLATLLGRPCATGGVDVRGRDGDGPVPPRGGGRKRGGGDPLPRSSPITKGAYEPRYASLKGIMAAKRKPLEVKDARPRPRASWSRRWSSRPNGAPGRIVGEGPEAAKELVRILREEANAL
jgi:electron transfer flavoprotein beta subunit